MKPREPLQVLPTLTRYGVLDRDNSIKEVERKAKIILLHTPLRSTMRTIKERRSKLIQDLQILSLSIKHTCLTESRKSVLLEVKEVFSV
jgi:hypothetical protein